MIIPHVDLHTEVANPLVSDSPAIGTFSVNIPAPSMAAVSSQPARRVLLLAPALVDAAVTDLRLTLCDIQDTVADVELDRDPREPSVAADDPCRDLAWESLELEI